MCKIDYSTLLKVQSVRKEKINGLWGFWLRVDLFEPGQRRGDRWSGCPPDRGGWVDISGPLCGHASRLRWFGKTPRTLCPCSGRRAWRGVFLMVLTRARLFVPDTNLLFLEGVPAGACVLRLLTHRFTIRIRGRLGLLTWFTPSHTPFATLTQHQNTGKTSSWGNCQLSLFLEWKNKFTNIPPEKKKTQWRGPPETVAWYMGFIWERGLTLWVWGAWSVSNPYFICIHLSSSKSYQPSITDSRLSTVGW